MLRRDVSKADLWALYKQQLGPGHKPLGRQNFIELLSTMRVRMNKHTQWDAFSCYYCRLVAQWKESEAGIPPEQIET